jgi:hypothetical protein
MRAREFILLEYRRDITAERLGPRLLDALTEIPTNDLPPELRSVVRILHVYKNPTRLAPGPIKLEWGDNEYMVSSDNVEQIYRQLAPEILDTALTYLENKDPTTNKQFVPWMIRSVINSQSWEYHRFNWEDFNKNNLLGRYQRLKQGKQIQPEHADINKFKTYQDFESTMYEYYQDKLTDQVKERGKSETLLNNDDIRVIRPLDEKASCYYGQGTKWCTAATQGSNYFETYNERGPLFIIIPKKPKYTGEKYQLWINNDEEHSGDYQFMDLRDHAVNLPQLIATDPRFRTLKNINPEVDRFISRFIDLMPEEKVEQYILKAQTNIDRIIDELFDNVSDKDKEKFKMDVGGMIDLARVRRQLQDQSNRSQNNPWAKTEAPTVDDIYKYMSDNILTGFKNTEFEHDSKVLVDWLSGLELESI